MLTLKKKKGETAFISLEPFWAAVISHVAVDKQNYVVATLAQRFQNFFVPKISE